MEQNIENVEVASSILALGNSFDFGDNIKRAALLIHARERVGKDKLSSMSRTGE